MHSKLLLMMGLCALAWVACKKESPQLSKTELITSGLWIPDKARVEPSVALFDNQGNVVSYTSNFWWVAADSCSKNADFTFYPDSTFYTNDNSNCPNYSNSGQGYWKFLDNENSLEFSDYLGNRKVYKMEVLNNEELVYSISQQFRNQTHKVLFHFKH